MTQKDAPQCARRPTLAHHRPPNLPSLPLLKQFGSIADCWTELGDFESAALFYDKYISAMNGEAAV